MARDQPNRSHALLVEVCSASTETAGGDHLLDRFSVSALSESSSKSACVPTTSSAARVWASSRCSRSLSRRSWSLSLC